MDGIDRRARNTFAYGGYEAVCEIKTIRRYIETMSLKARNARQPDWGSPRANDPSLLA
jgi:hypothetical protein